MGISVGTNGVSVYEYAGGYMPALLVWQGSIADWAHIAVVYKDNQPTLYINGVKVKEGVRSSKTVHPSFGFGGGSYGYFAGVVDEIRMWGTARTEPEIKGAMNTVLSLRTPGLLGNWHANEQFSSQATDATDFHNDGTLYNGVARVISGVSLQPLFTWTADPLAGSGMTEPLTGDRIEVTPTAANTYTYTVQVADANGTPLRANVVVTVGAEGNNLDPRPGITQNRNFVVENVVLRRGIKDDAGLSLPVEDLNQTITYLDDLGRPVQKVVTQGSPDKKDLVSYMVYDELGRTPKAFLPYASTDNTGLFKDNAVTAQAQFYQTLKGDAVAYAETRFESSPLNRVLEQGAPGAAWQLAGGHTIKNAWRTNGIEEIRYWQYDEATGRANGQTFYTHEKGLGELMVTEMLDEHNYRTLEFKDWEGRVVCKQVQENTAATTYLVTYYVYDDYGQLRYTLPPEAVARLNTELTTAYLIDPSVDGGFIGRWLFTYQYDNQGRVTEKRTPGVEPLYMVYNQQDQLVLTQDGRQRKPYTSNGITYAAGQWNFTKYDVYGRTVMTGLYQHGSVVSQAEMQALLNSETVFEEIRDGSTLGYTSNRTFPRANITPLQVSYYDNYNYPGVHAFVPGPCSGSFTYFTRLEGKPTGSRVKMLQSTEQWLVSTPYYDKYGHVIEVIADTHLKNGAVNSTDIAFTCYDAVTGDVLLSEVRHANPQALGAKARTVRTRSTLDHAGRVKATYQQIDKGAEERLAAFRYNEAGELVTKQVGSATIQTMDYTYNIRGWLTHINNGTLNTAQNDKFALELAYNTGTNGPFNGNISSQKWVSASDQVTRQYSYTYDPPDRLIAAGYSARNAQNQVLPENYSLDLVRYDKNGNILQLKRNSIRTSSPQQGNIYGLVDDLTYSYTNAATVASVSSGNQLANVRDLTQNQAQTTATLARDFMEGSLSATATEYTYDENGNILTDANKNITTIQYNYLGLPSQIVLNNDPNRRIENIYDAAGTKVRKIVYTRTTEGLAITRTTDYVAGMVYEENVLQFIPTSEGRWLTPEALPSGEGAIMGAYEYQYLDHLGNLRLAVRKAPDIPVYKAGMETAFALTEEATFDNINTTRDATHARTGTKAARVNKDRVLGPWRTFAVKKGDKVQAKAYAFYETTGATGSRVQLQPYLETFGTTFPTTGEKTNNSYPKLLAGVRVQVGQPTSTGQPIAYLKWIFYDTQGNVLDSRIKQVTSLATTEWELLATDDFVANQDGSLQVLVANESEKNVWFDDIEITHTQDLIVQETHYDPWGLELVGIGKTGNPEDDWQFQGKEFIADNDLDWSDFGARQYDAQLGRWHAADPADQFASPYTGMGNNPINRYDPDGRIAPLVIAGAAIIGGGINLGIKLYQGKIHSFKDGAVAFGIGAVAGAAGAVTGGAAFAAAGGAAGGAGGFIAGVTGGAAGAAVSSPIQAMGNAAYFGDPYSARQFVTDVVVGAALGGVVNGGIAVWKGNNFWNGNAKVSATSIPGTLDGPKVSVPDPVNSPSGTVSSDDLTPIGAWGPDENGAMHPIQKIAETEIHWGMETLDDGARMVEQPFMRTGINSMDDFLASATQPSKQQGLTEAGRALQKHSGRAGSVFQDIKFSHKTANQEAMKILNDILNSQNRVIRSAQQGGYEIFDAITRRGVGVSRNGLFNGFREF
jgi:RHS repeat-associated protein